MFQNNWLICITTLFIVTTYFWSVLSGQEKVSSPLVSSFFRNSINFDKKDFKRVDFQGIFGIWEWRIGHYRAAGLLPFYRIFSWPAFSTLTVPTQLFWWTHMFCNLPLCLAGGHIEIKIVGENGVPVHFRVMYSFGHVEFHFMCNIFALSLVQDLSQWMYSLNEYSQIRTFLFGLLFIHFSKPHYARNSFIIFYFLFYLLFFL